MAVETIRVEMLGASFTIQTDESREYVESILAYLGSKVDKVSSSSRVDDPLKASILAGVYIVDELFRERVENSVRAGLAGKEHDEISAVAERIIARIDTTLGTGDIVPPGIPKQTRNGDTA
jgi:cell division protein ZapA (FtsZ GTPase activity inhibitor)